MFSIRDIPGSITDDVRLSLAGQSVDTGFLELVPTDEKKAEGTEPSAS